MVVYLLQLAAWTAFMAALILWPAGTLAYPGGWAFIAFLATGGVAMILWLSKHSPGLLRERMAPPLQRHQKPWDRVWLSLFMLGFCAWMAFMGWDAARSGFTAVPAWVQLLGGLAIVVTGTGTWWTFRENSFAAPVVKIQQGQKVSAWRFPVCSSQASPGARCMRSAACVRSSGATRTTPRACGAASSHSSGSPVATSRRGRACSPRAARIHGLSRLHDRADATPCIGAETIEVVEPVDPCQLAARCRLSVPSMARGIRRDRRDRQADEPRLFGNREM